MEPLVVPLSALDRTALPLAGGKGANLGELLRAGFPVPDGFCLTTAAYNQFVAAAGIAPRLAALLAGLDPEDAPDLATRGAAVRDLFYHAAIPREIARAVRAAARDLNGSPLAVRSSATAEDLPEASFAGQQESYLNVVGDAPLLDAVRRCWASLWTDRAIAYRQRNAIAHEGVALAVVVQRMVPAEVAGVLFTANPVSGRRDEIVIEASLGLGEAVVAGLVTPDRYRVGKPGLHIAAKEIGDKRLRVVGVPAGGTARLAVDDAASQTQALSDEAIVVLARLGGAVETHLGAPQDVEWAFAGGKLALLQSRPITSLFPAPPAAPAGELRVYLSLNSVQGMLEPFTPMGASLLTGIARGAWSIDDSQPFFLVELGGRLYADVTGLLRSTLGRNLPTLVLPETEPVAGRILEQLLDDPRLGPTGGPGRGAVLRFLLRNWRTVLPLAARLVRFVLFPDEARRHVERVIVPRLAAARAEAYRPIPLGRQAEIMRRFASEGIKATFLPHLVPLVASGMFCYKQAEARVKAYGLDRRLLATARQGLPHNKTTTMDLDLWALARAVGADVPAREALLAGAPADLAARYQNRLLPATLQQGMTGFLDRYGHRGIREIDVGMPRWGEDPTYLFGVLRSYLALAGRPPDEHFARQAEAAEQAVAALVAQARLLPGGWRKAALIGFFLRRYRRLGGLRETPKFYLMWLFQALRAMLLDAGRRLVAAGHLDAPEDVFFLSAAELSGAGEEAFGLRQVVAARRRAYQHELARPRAPRVITSEGQSFYGEALLPAANVLAGTGVSPGVARGPVRVIRNPVGARLDPAEILVVPSTDPAWTPLFLTAGGLVMEAGGMMSHGAIVAREYGIPAVVGVAEATSRLSTGEPVEVDGNEGLVRIL